MRMVVIRLVDGKRIVSVMSAVKVVLHKYPPPPPKKKKKALDDVQNRGYLFEILRREFPCKYTVKKIYRLS